MNVFHNLRLCLFKLRIKNLDVGTPEWRLMQEKVRLFPQLGIGSEKRRLFYSKTLVKCGNNIDFHPDVILYFAQNIKIGNSVLFNRGVLITARESVTIGDNVLVGPYTVINTSNHRFDDPNIPIRQQGHISKAIIIEDDVWIGANCVILSGVHLKKGTVVGAGSIVNKSFESYSVIAGVPAKLIRKRK